jgi:predicted component of type VI protein secretion system
VTIQENGKGAVRDVGASELEKQGLVPRDIALRLSTDLKDPIGGFHFGRNKQRCDIVIGQNDNSRRISNVHFRIYINEHRVLMLEDQSTNGTAVDGTLLRGKEKENGRDWRHTLEQGSVIVLTMTPPEEDYRFIVRIPQRDHESENVYQQNLNAFFLRMTNTQLENETRAAAANGTAKRQPVRWIFPHKGIS